MNLLKIYPEKFRENYKKNIKNAGIEKAPEEYHNFIFKLSLIIALISISFFYFLKINLIYSLGIFILLNIFFYFKTNLKATTRIKKMEILFPDVISLMASNLRSGITIERAFLLAARPEFAPLDKEILNAGKDITTGIEIVHSLKKMSEKINSEKISKIINLINSGLKAGGNIADLLEQTSSNMKEKEVLEKKAASTTLMYVIFIFVAVAIGAPVLFALSSVLVEVVISLAERVPDAGNIQMNLPLTFSKVAISVNFIIYFAIFFMIVTDFISCHVIGVVNKGEGKAGLKYFLPIIAISILLFFLIRKFASGLLLGVLTST
ncbi:MAG: type II secretion system F family protein [Nanoarchaeota archaeon]|nr:type II secretion system F family protein [Nanoarchaeota archaeon]MBU1027474.1 type II secretion system F family protein [Nanoarchaeota archaeon]